VTSAADTPRTAAAKAAAATLRPLPLRFAGAARLDLLTTFLTGAPAAQWPSWVAIRANVIRFRMLSAYYVRVTA
jgi:hypothetical protein